MTWTAKVKHIKVGDRVAYSFDFLHNTGQLTGPIPFARGTVKSLKEVGETVIAIVSWNDPDVPERVNAANICRTNSAAFAR